MGDARPVSGLTPRGALEQAGLRCVSFRTRFLNRPTAFGAIRRLGTPALVKLNPRNFRFHGRATALFCWFTLSLSFVVMYRVTLSITRAPARRLRT